jgi:signal transduction histidine kinase
VSVGIPKEVAFAEANRTLTRNLVILAGVSLLVLVAAWAEAQFSLLRPFGTLLGVIERFEGGDASARVGGTGGSSELGHLGRAFDQMAATLEARERERDRSEEALRLHSARTEALVTLAARLNAQHDVDAMASVVCQETTRALETSAASVCLYDEERDVLETICRYGFAEDLGKQIEALESRTWAQGLKTSKSVVIPELLTSPELPNASMYSALDIRSLACIPMVYEGRLVGTLCIFAQGQETHDYTEEEVAFLKAIADQAAQAIVNAHLYEALLKEQSARAALLDKTISAQEEERKRIARDLHDETSQDLAALMLSLDTCALSLASKGPRGEQHLQTAKSIAETMLGNIHRLINDLRPSLLDDLGLAPAILWCAERQFKSQGIIVTFQCDRMEARLPPSLETALFRIAQEALTNTERHAHATQVQIALDVENHHVQLTVQDNGTGFEAPARRLGTAEGRGLGLRGIQERAALLGGEVLIHSTPGQGTTVAVTIPMVKEVHADVQDPRTADR